jgi:hypothetical protein
MITETSLEKVGSFSDVMFVGFGSGINIIGDEIARNRRIILMFVVNHFITVLSNELGCE